MKEHPLLFSTEMVRAILEGRKTQTRRIVKFPKDFDGKKVYKNHPFGLKYSSDEFEDCVRRLDSKWDIGDILWVRESFNIELMPAPPEGDYDEPHYFYKATEKEFTGMKWKPSIHMPKEACRLRLKITDIRVERLQNISEEDAIAEGIFEWSDREGKAYHWSKGIPHTHWFNFPDDAYEALWEQINGPDSWNANPWVWVIQYEKQ